MSDATATKIYAVMRKYVRGRQMQLILKELAAIPGNKSFRDTITKLLELDAQHKRDDKE